MYSVGLFSIVIDVRTMGNILLSALIMLPSMMAMPSLRPITHLFSALIYNGRASLKDSCCPKNVSANSRLSPVRPSIIISDLFVTANKHGPEGDEKGFNESMTSLPSPVSRS